MMVRLGRPANVIVRAPGPVTVASTICHTPWIVRGVDCAPAPWPASSPMLSAATKNVRTTHLLREVWHSTRLAFITPGKDRLYERSLSHWWSPGSARHADLR